MQEQNVSLCLEARKKLSMTGVSSVDGFSEQHLKLTVGDNKVYILGNNIKITSYNNASGAFSADGEFIEIKYGIKKDNIIKRMFK